MRVIDSRMDRVQSGVTDLMSIFSVLSHFSAVHCIAICAVLVPVNLLVTLQTLIFTGLRFPAVYAQVSTGLAALCTLAMVLHVYFWFAMGVVMMPTFILLGLALMCLGVNLLTLAYPAVVVRLAGVCESAFTEIPGFIARLKTTS